MIRLKELLLEMPMLGQYLLASHVKIIGDSLNIKLNDNDLIFNKLNATEIGDDYWFVDSTVSGDMYDRLIVLFRKTEDKNILCFASLLEQLNFEIEGSRPYKVSFSAKYDNFPKYASAKTYCQFIKKSNELICSDYKLSDAGSGIWKELLTRPNLTEEIFVWNVNENRREPTLNFEDIFGVGEKYKNYLVVLKPKI